MWTYWAVEGVFLQGPLFNATTCEPIRCNVFDHVARPWNTEPEHVPALLTLRNILYMCTCKDTFVFSQQFLYSKQSLQDLPWLKLYRPNYCSSCYRLTQHNGGIRTILVCSPSNNELIYIITALFYPLPDLSWLMPLLLYGGFADGLFHS